MGVTYITPVEITPGTADAWTDVDLSSYIASGSTGVLLHVVNTDVNNYSFGLRKNGSTDNRYSSNLRGATHKWQSIGVDGNRILELYVDHTTYIDVYLIGYFDDSAVFNTNATDISLSTTSEWTDIDINVGDSAIGAIVEVAGSWSSSINFGFRKNGSTDNRIDTTRGQVHGFIGLDENEILEGYISSTSLDFYLIGYIKSGITFNTNATDLSISDTAVWTDLSTLPSGATGGFIEIISGSSLYFGLRENGSSEDIYRAVNAHTWGIVECDENRLIEGEISHTNVDFFLIGYTTSSSASQNLSLTGISSTVSIGTPTISSNYNLSLTGISSTVSIGTPTLVPGNVNLTLTGISSSNSFGTITYGCGSVSFTPTSIDSTVTIGTPTLNSNYNLSLTGITNTSSFGIITYSVGNVNLSLAGIPSTVTIGTPSFNTGNVNLQLTGISSTETIGSPTFAKGNVNLSLTGISSSANIGNISFSLGNVNLSLSGIDSTVSIGNPILSVGTTILSLTGIESTASIGNITFGLGSITLPLSGIDSTVNIGVPSINSGNVNLQLTGISNTNTFGNISFLTGNTNLSLTGINSTASIGNITLSIGNVNLPLNGISSTASIGTPTFQTGNVNLELTGIDSSVSIGSIAFGLGAVTLPLTGIDSTVSIGTLDLVEGNVNLQLSGISSTVSIGTPSITTFQQTLSLNGISSTLTIGTPILNSNYNLSLSGITNINTFGNISFIAGNVNLPLTGVPSSVSIGSLTYSTGNVDLSLSGIPSSCSIGNITLNSNYNLSLTGITNSSSIGTPTISTPSNGVTWSNPVEITPAVAGAWTDVDLSAYVQDGTSGVMLHVETTDVRLDWGARKNGSTDDRHIENYYASHTGFSVGIDEHKVLEIYVESTTNVNVYLVGYMDFCAVFNTNATDVSLSSTGTWTDIDINVDNGAIGAIVEVYNTGYNSSREFGLRKNGSSDNRHTYILGKTSAFIGVDNDVLEGYIGNTGVDFYLTGYVKSGIVFLTNATDLSMTTTGSYADLTALPEGSIGGFIEYSSPELSVYNGALRVNGSSEDIYRSLARHGWLPVQCDANHLIEGKISSTNLDFFLTAYATVSSQYMNLAGIPSTATIGNISVNHLLSVTGINSTTSIGTISFSVGNTNLVLSGINSTLTIGNVNLFNNTATTIYKLTTQITSRDIAIDIVKRNIGLTVTDRDISVDITRRNIDISAVEREIDFGIEVS